MSNTALLRAIGGVGDDLIERAAPINKAVRSKTVPWTMPWFKWAVPAAACLALVIIGAIVMSRLPAVIDYPFAYDPTVSPTEPALVSPTASPSEPALVSPTISPSAGASDPPAYNPNIGGGGNDISHRFFPTAENIYVASQIVGQDAGENWYVDVYLSMPPEEAIALPALYQMIIAFGISKEELIRENENHIGTPNHLDEYVINALYKEEALMMYLLRHPLALFFDGEIYTYYQMRGSLVVSDVFITEPLDHIPADVKDEYFALVEARSEADETLRELKESIDAFWQGFETEIHP